MDLDFLKDVQHANNTIIDDGTHSLENSESLESCPKCHSQSYLNNECQYCSYVKPLHILGEPLGHKSFYSLSESYYKSLNTFDKNHLLISRENMKYKRYLNKVKLRYNDILDYFYDKSYENDQYRAIFLQELTDIIIFFIDESIDESEIWRPFDRLSKDQVAPSSLFTMIKEAIDFAYIEKKKSRFGLSRFLLNEDFAKFSTFLLVLCFIIGFSYFWLRFDIAKFN